MSACHCFYSNDSSFQIQIQCTHISRNQWKHAFFVQFPQSDTLDIGHRDAVAVKPCRLFRTRDLCSSPLQHGTIVPCVN